MANKIKVIITKERTIKKSGKIKPTPKGKKVVKSKAKQKDKITKDILMGELVSKYPQTSEVLLKYGLHCIGCMLSPYETLEAGVAVHGIQLKPFLKELNQVINKKTKN